MLKKLLFLCGFIPALLVAQNQPLEDYYYDIKQLTVEQGLAQNYTYDVVQGSQGFLWVATADGLSRYDGFRFKTFTTQDSLAENFITKLYRDSKDRLWIGHYEGRITLYKNGKFSIAYPKPTFDRINAITEDTNENVWFLLQSSGILQYTPKGEFKMIEYPVAGLIYRNMVQTGHKRYLFETDAGFFSAILENNGKFLLSETIRSEMEDRPEIIAKSKRSNEYYVRYGKKGIFLVGFDEFTDTIKTFNKVTFADTSTCQISAMATAKDGNFLLSSEDGRMFIINQDSALTKMFPLPVKLRVKSSSVRKAFVDDDGTFWLGTIGEGIFSVSEKVFSRPVNIKDFCADEIVAMHRGPDHKLYYAARQAITVFDKKTRETSCIGKSQGLPDSVNISSITVDLNNEIWVGTENDGIFKVSGTFGNYRISKYALPDQNIKMISWVETDSKNRLVLSTYAKGLIIYNKQTNSLKGYKVEQGLTRNDVYRTFEDTQHRIWIATHGGYLYYLERDTLKFFDQKKGAKAYNYNAFCEDQQGNIWVATYGSGILKYEKEQDIFIPYGTKDGILSDYVYALACDKSNNIWASTRSGLSKIQTDNGQIYNFKNREYFPGLELTSNNIIVDQQGNLIVGTTQGVISYNPTKARQNIKPPRITITSVKVFNNAYDFEGDIRLPYNDYQIDFEFIGVSFFNADKVRYQYMLEGHDKTWSVISPERNVRYSSLKNGKYTFLLKAANSEGVWTKEPLRVTIIIDSPFWQSWWFIALVISGVVLIVYLIIKIRIRIFKAREEELNREVAIRTQEITKQSEEIEQFAYAISHDLKNPVLNLKGLVGLANETFGAEEGNTASKELISLFEQTTDNLYNNLMGLMDVIKAKSMNTDEKDLILVEELLDEILTDSKQIISNTGAIILRDLEIKSFYVNKLVITSALKNLISNALKYSRPNVPPRIVIKNYTRGKFLCIEVEDNGLGFDTDKDKEKVFGMFKRIHDHVEGTGIGLHLVKKMLERAGGDIDVNSEINKGSTFVIFIPII